MNPEQATAAVMLINAEYGARQGDLDEWILAAWHQRLEHVELTTWAAFANSWDRHIGLQSTRWPPAPIDFDEWQHSTRKGATEWQRSEARRVREHFSNELTTGQHAPVSRNLDNIRQLHFGNKLD